LVCAGGVRPPGLPRTCKRVGRTADMLYADTEKNTETQRKNGKGKANASVDQSSRSGYKNFSRVKSLGGREEQPGVICARHTKRGKKKTNQTKTQKDEEGKRHKGGAYNRENASQTNESRKARNEGSTNCKCSPGPTRTKKKKTFLVR